MLGNAGARQLLLFAKPWQRALVGAALVGVGLAIGALVITVVGAVVVITTLFVAARSMLSKRALGGGRDEDSD